MLPSCVPNAPVFLRPFANGGEVVDSSPMYGSSQDVLGNALNEIGNNDSLFAADKIWTRDGDATRQQFTQSASKWNLDTFDLMQVHNLLAWESHLDTLEAMKVEGKVRLHWHYHFPWAASPGV